MSEIDAAVTESESDGAIGLTYDINTNRSHITLTAIRIVAIGSAIKEFKKPTSSENFDKPTLVVSLNKEYD